MHMNPFTVTPIGIVRSTRKQPTDDHWLAESGDVEIDATQFTPDVLAGLDAFSHVLIVYVMHAVDPGEVEIAARHPRNRADWPRVGIFAQRAKRRPNRIGVSCCRLLGVDRMRVRLEGLDAIDGTPILDIKPWVREFGPRGEVLQPEWMTDLMKDYF
jgi:tRNA-Thr(GGU) m(6)t(6)A37 methyltransferase TsaA